MFNLFKREKKEVYASDLAEVTFSYMERSEKIFEMFLAENGQQITDYRRKEILCLLFNIYRLGFVLSKFDTHEKKLVVKHLLTMTYLNEHGLDIDLDFISDRVTLYDKAVRDSGYGNDYGSPLLAQFIAICDVDTLAIIDDFREVAKVTSELIRTATLRNNQLSKDHAIVDEL